jgi:hypothetical protein
VAIVTRLIFSVPPSSAGQPFSAAHFSGHCFGLIPASCSFTASITMLSAGGDTNWLAEKHK